jgi:[ribosomal protein S18]-alanine N-acetyltransferase
MIAIQPLPAPRIRSMREGDLATVLTIDRKAYEFPWTEGIFRDCLRVGYHCRVLEQVGDIIAYGVLSVAASEAHLLNLCVRPESQRQGYGRRMLNHLVDLANRAGADVVLLEVRVSNESAIALYNALGFNEIGQRKQYYPARQGREDALILALAL